jgi:type VI secretion system protein ImpL
VSVGLDALLSGESDGKNAAEAIKARIQELMNTFRTRLPIYVFVNKCDLISGFQEFFDDLGSEDRDQVFGVTLGAESKGSSAKVLQDFSADYDLLVQRLSNRLIKRLDEEHRGEVRRTLFTFPQQMAGLKRPLDRFLSDIFRPSRYTTQPLLRGVYFTSGMQQGVPVDGLMSAHASAYDLSPEMPRAQQEASQSFFIHRILSDVVFPEQHLAGTDRELERNLAVYHLGAYAVLLVFTVGLIGAWWYSVARADPTLETLNAQLNQFETDRTEFKRRPSVQTAIEAILNLEPDYNQGTIPDLALDIMENFGLLAQVHLEPRINAAFVSAADAMLVPSMTREIGNSLTEAIRRQADPSVIRELLLLYIGIGEREMFDRSRMDNWASRTTKQFYPLEPQKQQQANDIFGFTFDTWPGPQKINSSLVQQAREALFSVPPAEQVYSELKANAFQAGVAPQSLQTILGIRDSQLFVYRRSAGERAPTVPNLFTADGFYNLFIKRTPTLITDVNRDDPLSGRNDGTSAEEAKKVIDRVTQAYTLDYIATWNEFVDGVHLRPLRNVQDANRVLETLSGNASPMTTLLNAVANNTILPLSRAADPSQLPTQGGGSSGGGGAFGALTQQASGGQANAQSTAANTAASQALAQLGPFSRWPGSSIAEPFQPLQDLVVSRNNQQPGIQDVQQRIVNLYSAINLIATAPDIQKAAFDEVKARIDNPRNSAITAVATAAVSQPSPVQEIMSDLAKETWRVLLEEAQAYLNAQWQQTVVPACQSAIFQRYPVHRDAKDETTITDFGNFFSPTGTLETFFKTYLDPFVDTSSTPWKTRQVDGRGLSITPETLEAFANARVVADAFFPNAAPTPNVTFTMRPTFLDPRAGRVAIDTGASTGSGSIFTYRHEPPRDLPLTWPNAAGGDKVTITITDLNGASTSFVARGPWAWFRLFDHFGLQTTGLADRYQLPVTLKKLEARFDVTAASVTNPFLLPALTNFRCRGDL